MIICILHAEKCGVCSDVALSLCLHPLFLMTLCNTQQGMMMLYSTGDVFVHIAPNHSHLKMVCILK